MIELMLAIALTGDVNFVSTSIFGGELTAAKAVTRPVEVATPPPKVVRSAQPTKTVRSNYVPRWYPGGQPRTHAALRAHVIADHGGDPTASNAELFRMHDAWHDANGPASPKSRARVQKTYSNCPGGVCPTNTSRSYRTGWYLGKNLGR